MAEQKRTQFAMQALGFAELFNIKVGDQPVSGHRVQLTAPEGPSTGGGKQSVQHISLIPPGGGSVVVAGSADQVEKKAEIRTWEYLAQMHAQRFKGKTLPIDRNAYTDLVRRMQHFFSDQGLRVVMIDAPPGGAAEPAPAGGSSKMVLVAVFLVVALAVAVAAFFLLRK
jgi:hypothetical protein